MFEVETETDCFHLCVATAKERRAIGWARSPWSYAWFFEIPESALTINGLIGGLKESLGRIHGEILVKLMQALEERMIEAMMDNDPGRYQRNGRQSRSRQLRCSLATIGYRFAQLGVDRAEAA